MKKSLIIAVIMFLIVGILGGSVNAAGSMGVSAKTVDLGSTVTITVSFGQKVKTAQFNLKYDATKLEYVSYSCGGSGISNFAGGKFGYYGATSDDVSSVSFKFKAKALGTGSVSASNLKISSGTQTATAVSIGNSSTAITIKEATKQTTTPPKTTTPTKTTTKKKTNTTKNNNENSDKAEEVAQEPQLAPNEFLELDAQGAMTLEYTISKIIVKGLPIAIEDGAKLNVNLIKEQSNKYNLLTTMLKNIEGKRMYFNIQLLKDEQEIQPKGYVTVYVPIPDGYNKEDIVVYSIDEETGEYELVEGEIRDNYYAFTTDHLSTYALVEKEEITQEIGAQPITMQQRVMDFFTNLTVIYVIVAILMIVVIILIVRIIKLKKQRD